MSSRPVLAAALILGCSWVSSLAQQPETTTVRSPAVVASGTLQSSDAAPGGARHRGDDESAQPAAAIQLASADAGLAAAAAPARPASTDTPREWVLVGAGVWLMLAVSRRRKRGLAH